MKESVALAKDADAKKDFSSTRSDKSILRLRNEPEKQLGSLRGVIGNIRHDGGTPSLDSIATELSSMHTAQRASVLLALQRTHGNLYVQRVVAGIQAKLKVGQPGDVYEQEADRMADLVMRMPEPRVRQPEEEEEEELIQTKPLADQITPLIQRPVEEEEEEILQTKENPDLTPEVTSDLESRIQALKGGGQPLPEANRGFMEREFGIDFSGVRLHTDSDAAQMNRELNSEAFTYGRDIMPQVHHSPVIIAHPPNVSVSRIDTSRNSAQLGAMLNVRIAYGYTEYRVHIHPAGRPVAQPTGQGGNYAVYLPQVDLFLDADHTIYITNQFPQGSCFYDWTLGHEVRHWIDNYYVLINNQRPLINDLHTLPGRNNPTIVQGQNAARAEMQRIENRVATLRDCTLIQILHDINREGHALDQRDYRVAFSTCPAPRPQVPPIPALPGRPPGQPPQNCLRRIRTFP